MGLLQRIFGWLYPRAATPENPRFSLHDPTAVEVFLGGAQSTTAGIRINRDTALTDSSFWRAQSLISATVAKIPVHVYRRRGEGKERDPDHPAYRLLRRQPNELMTAFVWKQTMMHHALMRGNGYSYVLRDGAATPVELLPLSPDHTYPVLEQGRLWYVTEVDGEQRKLPPADVLHWKGLGYDGIMGYDLITYIREALGLSLGLQRYASTFFGNNARPNTVLTHPAKLSEQAKQTLRESWERMHQGLTNAHRTAILDQGLQVHELSINASDAQMIESRQFSARDIANFTGVPPHKIGDPTRTAYASLEQENQSFLDDCLDPWLCMAEEEFNTKLLTEAEKELDSHFCEFLRASLIRADRAATSSYYSAALGGAPWMTQNEVRARENLDPIEDGDTIRQPLNMAGPETAPHAPSEGDQPEPNEGPAEAPPPSESDEEAVMRAALRTALDDAVERMARRIGAQALRAAASGARYCAWLDAFVAANRPRVIEALQPAVGALAAFWRRSLSAADAADRLLAVARQVFEGLASSCTSKQLPGAVELAVQQLPQDLVREVLVFLEGQCDTRL